MKSDRAPRPRLRLLITDVYLGIPALYGYQRCQRTIDHDRSREDQECRMGFPEAWGGYSRDFPSPWGRVIKKSVSPGEESTGVVCFRHSGCPSPQTCFRRSDYRPRHPHPRCLGEQQRTRRRHFHQTGCVRGTLRIFRARVVCSMCRRFPQGLSFGLLGGAERPRLKGFYCQRC